MEASVVEALELGKKMRVAGVLNSAMVWRQAPQGAQGTSLRVTTTTAWSRMAGPWSATAAAMADCSAQVVRRKEAFSTLQPGDDSSEGDVGGGLGGGEQAWRRRARKVAWVRGRGRNRGYRQSAD